MWNMIKIIIGVMFLSSGIGGASSVAKGNMGAGDDPVFVAIMSSLLIIIGASLIIWGSVQNWRLERNKKTPVPDGPRNIIKRGWIFFNIIIGVMFLSGGLSLYIQMKGTTHSGDASFLAVTGTGTTVIGAALTISGIIQIRRLKRNQNTPAPETPAPDGIWTIIKTMWNITKIIIISIIGVMFLSSALPIGKGDGGHITGAIGAGLIIWGIVQIRRLRTTTTRIAPLNRPSRPPLSPPPPA